MLILHTHTTTKISPGDTAVLRPRAQVKDSRTQQTCPACVSGVQHEPQPGGTKVGHPHYCPHLTRRVLPKRQTEGCAGGLQVHATLAQQRRSPERLGLGAKCKVSSGSWRPRTPGRVGTCSLAPQSSRTQQGHRSEYMHVQEETETERASVQGCWRVEDVLLCERKPTQKDTYHTIPLM